MSRCNCEKCLRVYELWNKHDKILNDGKWHFVVINYKDHAISWWGRSIE